MEEFTQYLEEAIGKKLAKEVLFAILNTPPTVAIRINSKKELSLNVESHLKSALEQKQQVPWCSTGLYLPSRPNFTYDPAMHAGAYYVQDPSSMFLELLAPLFKEEQTLLDLCAAPGGKASHLTSLLPKSSTVIANEVIKSRTPILQENLTKWGVENGAVTSMESGKIAYLAQLHNMEFDTILVDAPCSGEGMFRKNSNAIKEWSQQRVHHSASRQKKIVGEIWPALKSGGHLIYSTCTFNKYENDNNIEWIESELGGRIISLQSLYPNRDIDKELKEWGVVHAACGGYRFLPGVTKGEGLFFAIVQKPYKQQESANGPHKRAIKSLSKNSTKGLSKHSNNRGAKYPFQIDSQLNPTYPTTTPQIELSHTQAIEYLKGNTLKPNKDTPLGLLLFTYGGLILGSAKNIGSRINNLYPKEWRIRQ